MIIWTYAKNVFSIYSRKGKLFERLITTMTLDKDPVKGQSYVCPVCGKTFVATDEHKYVICGGFPCSWKCFLSATKNIEKTRKDALAKKNK